MSEIPHQKSLKSRVNDELSALRKQEIAKNRRGKFKDEGAGFLTPEQAQTYLAELRLNKKTKEKPTPPTNLPSSELNDWYTQQRRMQLNEQKKRIEAEKLLRGYRSKLDHVNKNTNSPVRRRKSDDSIHVDVADITEEGIDNVMLAVENLEKDAFVVGSNNTFKLDMKKENDVILNDDVDDEHISNDDSSPKLNGDDLDNIEDMSVKEEEEEENATIINDVVDLVVNDSEPLQGETEANVEEETNEEKEKTKSLDEEETVEKKEIMEEKEEEEEVKPAEGEEEEIEGETEVPEITEDVTANQVEEEVQSVVEEEIKSESEFDREIERHDSFVVQKDVSDKNDTAGKEGEDEESWRDMISSEPAAKFPPEPNRYHLYVSHACPWAHRTVLVVALKGLENVIGITYVHPTWQYTKPGIDEHRGWVFGSKDGQSLTSTSGAGSFPTSWGEEDPIMGAKTIRDIYEKVDDKTERFILPVLWDKKLNTIVSNESSEIIRMLNFEFNDYASNSDLELYPESLAEKIDKVNQWIYPSFNNGVYRCGLASTQESYDVAIDELTKAFDKIDSILQKSRYITGSTFTEADVRLFVTLIRFDEVYDIYFKTNTRSVASTPAILNYVRDIYQMKNVAKTCVMDKIKAHYYTSHVELNKYSIIPRGVNFIGLLDKPHNRESLS
jgi:putative glutathione S-transferase